MMWIKLVLQIHNTRQVLLKEVPENINWNDFEYIISQTNEFQNLGLYYHGAKLWHLVDYYHYNNGRIIKDNDKLKKNLDNNQNNSLNIYLVWEEDEYPDSP